MKQSFLILAAVGVLLVGAWPAATDRIATLPTTVRKHWPTRQVAAAADPCGDRTVMNVVAHEDDDLLFLNPAVSDAIQAGDCVRTIYLSAGDDGRNDSYITNRETGAKTAYQTMVGRPLQWQTYQRTIIGKAVTEATPVGDAKISLLFLHLPDGNLGGDGFPVTGDTSLAKLRDRRIAKLPAVGSKAYSRQDLLAVLRQLIMQYHPAVINTQSDSAIAAGGANQDHSDHIATGDFVNLAAGSIQTFQPRVIHYEGYDIRDLSSNLTDAQTSQKASIFFSYGAFDPGVCLSIDECAATGSAYGAYLSRQYRAEP